VSTDCDCLKKGPPAAFTHDSNMFETKVSRHTTAKQRMVEVTVTGKPDSTRQDVGPVTSCKNMMKLVVAAIVALQLTDAAQGGIQPLRESGPLISDILMFHQCASLQHTTSHYNSLSLNMRVL
jgi:hypothetical protein